MNKKKMILSVGITGLLVTGGYFIGNQLISNNQVSANAIGVTKEDGNEIAQKAITQLENQKDIEYIKETNKHNQLIKERWRDHNTHDSRVDLYMNGRFTNRKIVKEDGKRIIEIGNDNGKLGGTTWILPDKIVKENKRIGEISLFNQIVKTIQSHKWNFIENVNLPNGITTQKIQSADGEVFYIEKSTGFPVMREYYNNTMLIIEEYKSFQDKSGEIFNDYEKVILKEIQAPVAGDDIGKG